MKKLAAFLMAAALCCTASIPAFAADTQVSANGGTGDTTLTFSVDTDYVVVIPETVALDEELVISSSLANTEPNMAVKVRISNLTADGKAELARTNDTDYKITAQAKQNSTGITNDTVVATFADVTTATNAPAITFDDPAAASGDIKAGNYTGTLTFTVSYEAE